MVVVVNLFAEMHIPHIQVLVDDAEGATPLCPSLHQYSSVGLKFLPDFLDPSFRSMRVCMVVAQ